MQNNKNLTFLYRAPKIELTPLYKDAIKKEYASIFEDENKETISTLSELTNGYAFAYQVIGYLFSKYKNIKDIYEELDQYLSIYVYNKIWSTLPKNEKIFLKCFSSELATTASIKSKVPYDDKSYSVYRDRLMKRGLIESNEYGKIKLILPRFSNFLKKQKIIY